jgi:hypothetical protein
LTGTDALDSLNDHAFTFLEAAHDRRVAGGRRAQAHATLLCLVIPVHHKHVIATLIRQYGGAWYAEGVDWLCILKNDCDKLAIDKLPRSAIAFWCWIAQACPQRDGVGVAGNDIVNEIEPPSLAVDPSVG